MPEILPLQFAAMTTLAAERHEIMLWALELIKILWVMAFGACVGSLLNVLVYRLPLGLDVVSPPSRCPSCETRLTWRENIPIFGWLALRGRCRFCGSRISAEYPLVEAFVALLWGVTFCVLFQDRWLGIPFYKLQPAWAVGGALELWPMFVIVVILFSALTAMTLIDARTFQIPMVLTWVPMAVGVLVHPLHALWLETTRGGLLSAGRNGMGGSVWTIATPDPNNWWLIGAALGGTAGMVIANVLLTKGLIRRSFADYPEWEAKALVEQAAAESAGAQAAGEAGEAAASPKASETGDNPTEMWIRYPHARREMFKEVVFLAPIIGLGLLGAAAAFWIMGPTTFDPITGVARFATDAPLWLTALAGSLMGLLVGGGVVWAARLFGTLAFGKEALGLGDVHLMAAVGACLGWLDPVLAFFGAAFLGVLWAVLGLISAGNFRRAMPFGPFLAAGTVLVWFGKPLIATGLGLLAGQKITLP